MRVWNDNQLSDIRKDYRDGVTIEILSDLNACTEDEIREIVGEQKKIKKIKPLKDPVKPRKIRPEDKPELHRQMRIHYDEGCSDREIERRMDVSMWIIRSWRIGEGLPPVPMKKTRCI